MKKVPSERRTRPSKSRQPARYHLFGRARIKLLIDDTSVDACIANISFSGVGLYAAISVPNNRQVKIKISFFDGDGKIQTSSIEGQTVWHSKLGNFYLMGIRYDKQITAANQPSLFKRLMTLRNRRI